MTGRPDAVSFGETMAAFLVDGDSPLATALRFRLTAAGSESTVMAGLAKLGHAVRFHTRVGADGLGRSVLRHLADAGIGLGTAVDSEQSTGVLARDLGQHGPVEVAYARTGSAGSKLCLSDIQALLSTQPRMLFLSGITPLLSATNREVSIDALGQARELGITVAFDPNLRRRLADPARARTVLAPFLDQADIVLAGADELTWLTRTDDPEQAARSLVAAGASSVVVKRGPEGAHAVDGTSSCDVPAYADRVVDPVGAGDALAAGYLSAVLRGQPLAEALHEASAVAACVVGAWGDLEGLPTSVERDAMLASRAHRSGGI
jgi:2-dehydro-3-deoxygluconokinase